MVYSLLADLIVAIHAAYVAFVVLGQLAILVGAAWNWNWVRNRWFRVVHLAAIVIVALEAIASVACPLTVWEHDLRRLAGQTVADGTFIGQLLHHLIFYDLPDWVFTISYLAFAALVVASLWLVPPRWRNSAATLARGASEGKQP